MLGNYVCLRPTLDLVEESSKVNNITFALFNSSNVTLSFNVTRTTYTLDSSLAKHALLGLINCFLSLVFE